MASVAQLVPRDVGNLGHRGQVPPSSLISPLLLAALRVWYAVDGLTDEEIVTVMSKILPAFSWLADLHRHITKDAFQSEVCPAKDVV